MVKNEDVVIVVFQGGQLIQIGYEFDTYLWDPENSRKRIEVVLKVQLSGFRVEPKEDVELRRNAYNIGQGLHLADGLVAVPIRKSKLNSILGREK